jgi:biotin transport system permease protein
VSTPSLLGVHTPHDTALHRLPAGAKLLALVGLSIVVVVARGPWTALALLGAVLVAVAWSRMGRGTLLRALRGLLLVAVLLGGYQAWQRGCPVAVEVVADLLTLVLTSLVLTATTPMDAMLDTLARALGPFRRLGVDPERVALAFSLMIRAVPETLQLALETRDAARARGLGRSPRALLVPFVLRVVAQARETGEALDARGIGD